MSCGDCKFYESLYSGSSAGHCHRHAPRPLVVAGGVDGTAWSFPEVIATNWCGDFQQRPTQRAADGTKRPQKAVDAPKPCDNFRKARDGKCFNCGYEQSAHR